MEVWVYLMAAVWLIKYARERVSLTEPFRQARPALILFTLWLGYGILQMIPLPAVGGGRNFPPHRSAPPAGPARTAACKPATRTQPGRTAVAVLPGQLHWR